MKNLITLTALFCFFVFQSSFASFTSIEEGSLSQKKVFSENQFGFGLSAAKDFKIIDNVLFENNKDYFFNEVGVFANYFGDKIDYNYGANFSFGYGYDKFGIYLSSGYLITEFEYILNTISKNYSKGSAFIGTGASYKINNNLKFKLDFMGYRLEVNSSNSSNIKKTEANLRNLTLGLQFYF